MKSFNLLAPDVEIKELAAETKNYSGAELEGLVRAAQSTAMNRHIKVLYTVDSGLISASSPMSHAIKEEKQSHQKNCFQTHVIWNVDPNPPTGYVNSGSGYGAGREAAGHQG